MMKRIKEADEYTDEEMAIIDSEDDMPDGYFDIGEEDDIWADDYVGEDDDIEKTDLAESPDDEEFDDFDDEEEFDIEDPAYWDDAEEYDPSEYDVSAGPDLSDEQSDNWSALYDKEVRKGDPTYYTDSDNVGAEIYNFHKASGTEPGKLVKDIPQFAEPIHYDDDEEFEIEESSKSRGRRVKESLIDELNSEPALIDRNVVVTPEILDDAIANVGKDYRRIVNYLKVMYESKKPAGKRMKEDTSAFIVTPKSMSDGEIPEWVLKAFHESKGNERKFRALCESYSKR